MFQYAHANINTGLSDTSSSSITASISVNCPAEPRDVVVKKVHHPFFLLLLRLRNTEKLISAPMNLVHDVKATLTQREEITCVLACGKLSLI